MAAPEKPKAEQKPTQRPGASRAKDRPKRRGFEARKVLMIPQREGYHRHVFNDVGNNISRRIEDGYAIVEGEVASVMDERTLQASQMGAGMTKHVGGGVRGVLMEIPQEDYDEYQKERFERLDERDKQVKSAHKAQGLEGEITIDSGPEVIDVY
jgi:hypothetical protein